MCKNMTRLFLLLLSVMGFSVAAYAGADEEPVFENMQKRDSVLIGDQIRYGFRTTVEDGSTLEVAELPAVEGVEIISGFSLDTLKARRGRVEIEGSVVLTSFDSGAFVLPPYEVTVRRPDGMPDTLRFNPETLKVTTFPIDTATFVKHDIKGQITYPVTFMEVLPWLGGAVALGLCAWLIVWLANRKRKGVFSIQGACPYNRLEEIGLIPRKEILGTFETKDILYWCHRCRQGVYCRPLRHIRDGNDYFRYLQGS